jgi:peptide/nickel transport system substrate-binding protein
MIRIRTFPMAVGSAAAAAVLGLAACGSAASGGSTQSSPAPTNHVLNLSFLEDPGSGATDPAIYYAGQGIILQDNIYQGLLQYKGGTATPAVIPDLATSWTASKNNTVFTLRLRHGVLFHDGTPFTSAAVEPSFARDLAVGQGPSYMPGQVASVSTQGAYQVTIKLRNPNPISRPTWPPPTGRGCTAPPAWPSTQAAITIRPTCGRTTSVPGRTSSPRPRWARCTR